MANLILPSKRISQPQQVTAIDRSNALGKKVLNFWPLNDSRFTDIAINKPAVINGSAAVDVSSAGRFFKGGGTSYIDLGATSPITDINRPVSFAFYYKPGTAPAYAGLFTTLVPGETNRFVMMWSTDVGYALALGKGTGSLAKIPIAPPANGVGVWIVITCAAGLGAPGTNFASYSAFYNGVKTTGTAVTNSFTAQTGNKNYIGWDGADSKINGLLGNFVIFDGVLSDIEAFSYINNPWQILAPPPRRLFVAPSAGSGTSGTLARANLNDSVSASGTTSVIGALAKTNSVDSINASGSVGLSVTGSLSVTIANDSISASGNTAIVGVLAKTSVNDLISASGTASIQGSLLKTAASDSISANGSAGSITGTLAASNSNDSVSAFGQSGLGISARTGGGAGYPGRHAIDYQNQPKTKLKRHTLNELMDRAEASYLNKDAESPSVKLVNVAKNKLSEAIEAELEEIAQDIAPSVSYKNEITEIQRFLDAINDESIENDDIEVLTIHYNYENEMIIKYCQLLRGMYA